MGDNPQPPGFFPALQYFTDAITALPKEVMKQFTLMKEVEAKIYGPNEKLGEILGGLMEQPVPLRKQTASSAANATATQGLLSLTANNSTSGSANASLINGVTGQQSAQPSLSGSTNGEETADHEEDRPRRQQYQELRMLTHSLLANLDEKNVVLAEANRVLAQQETRLDSVMPHIDEEISEESRLGSMTHWAYSDNRQKTKATTTGVQNRRDVAATNNLAAAANMLHENEIAQARVNAGKEAAGEKTKGKRRDHAGDSDFDDKPRKGPKAGKGKAATSANAASAGLGISANGEPAPKRKKVMDKGLGAPGMERTFSAGGRGSKIVKDPPRSTPTAAEPAAKKAPRAKPAPTQAKKKLAGSTHNSPMLASSPLASSFNPATMMEPPPGARPQSARLRQNSSATNLRHASLQDNDNGSRPSSAAGKPNGNSERLNGRRKVQETTEDDNGQTGSEHTEKRLREASEMLKREEGDMPNALAEKRPTVSRSGSNSGKGSGRQSKVGTPRNESLPAGDLPGSRARSTRSRPNTGDRDDSSSVEPQMEGGGMSKHRRHASNSHLVKQLAPFNRSPDLDRHRSRDDADSDLDSVNGNHKPPEEVEHEAPDIEPAPELDHEIRRSSTRRPISRRNTANNLDTSPAPASRESSPPASPPQDPKSPTPLPPHTEPADDEDEDESEHDPDDPDEPKYCYCNRGSYGEMVACDNDDCPREWFHLGCTELREAPEEAEKWYCKECRPAFAERGKVGRRGGRGGRRGGG